MDAKPQPWLHVCGREIPAMDWIPTQWPVCDSAVLSYCMKRIYSLVFHFKYEISPLVTFLGDNFPTGKAVREIKGGKKLHRVRHEGFDTYSDFHTMAYNTWLMCWGQKGTPHPQACFGCFFPSNRVVFWIALATLEAPDNKKAMMYKVLREVMETNSQGSATEGSASWVLIRHCIPINFVEMFLSISVHYWNQIWGFDQWSSAWWCCERLDQKTTWELSWVSARVHGPQDRSD